MGLDQIYVDFRLIYLRLLKQTNKQIHTLRDIAKNGSK